MAAVSGQQDKLKRQRAGAYRTADGRFSVEQTSSGWLLVDAEQTDDLGLPLARGPFTTLDETRTAIAAARTGPRPTSAIVPRVARPATPPKTDGRGSAAHEAEPSRAPRPAGPSTSVEPSASIRQPARPARPAVVIREIRAVDGDALRALWRDVGFRGLGDDDRSLARMARRNPGLVLVAAEGSRIVGSALGAWDGRRGWIYHVATARTHRRQGIAGRLIDRIEAGLANLGCPKVNVIVRPDSDGGAAFWTSRGYGPSDGRQYGKELDAE